MSTTLVHAARAFTAATEIPDAAILFRDGVIESVTPRGAVTLPAGAQEIVAADKIATPGFLDVHIHGAGGHDVMEATDHALKAVSRMVAAHGTTSFVATTVTASPESICRSAEGIAGYIARQHQSDDTRAEVLGIHFEGPFISSVRRGVTPFGIPETSIRGSARAIHCRRKRQRTDSHHRSGTFGRDALH